MTAAGPFAETWQAQVTLEAGEPLVPSAVAMFWAAGDSFTGTGSFVYLWRLRLGVVGAGLGTAQVLAGMVAARVSEILAACGQDPAGVDLTSMRLRRTGRQDWR